MKGNLKKILPVIFSIVIFSSAFVFIILRSSNNSSDSLQIAPKNSRFIEKFGDAENYGSPDVSHHELVKNIRVNNTEGVSEPRIVCNPLNKNILAISGNDFSSTSNYAAVFISEDAGTTWKSKQVPLSGKFLESSYSDPWIDYDTKGNLYFCTVQFDMKNKGTEGIYLTSSSDNGTSWKTNLSFVDLNRKENISLDRPKFETDKSSLYENHIYVTWIEEKGLTSYVMFSRSMNGGESFTQPSALDKKEVEYSNLNSDKKGNLYISYLKDEEEIIFRKSKDGGATWGDEFSHVEMKSAGVRSEGHYVIKEFINKGIRINSEPAVTISSSGDILVAYSGFGQDKDVADIYFVKVNPITELATNPLRVNSDNTANDQFLPSITTDDINRIFIVYQDSRNDSRNALIETYASVSIDEGASFKDIKLSTESFNPESIVVDKYIGDYNSCVVSGDQLIGVWTDGRNKNLDIYSGSFSIQEFISNMMQ